MISRPFLTRLTAAMAASLLFGAPVLGVSPNPPFPVGRLAAYPMIVQTGIKPALVWSIDLPSSAENGDFVFFIRQVLIPAGIIWDLPVERTGETLSQLSIDPGAARFELWAVDASTSGASLLDETVVGPYLPQASVRIRSEDPYPVLPRTRADRQFHVDITVAGLISDPVAPPESKSVAVTRRVQSYGTTGTGSGLDRSQATLLSTSSIATNGVTTHTFALNSVPGEDRAKARGEERFTVSSLPSDLIPESVIASRFIQIWPVADGGITGISQGQAIGADVPEVSLRLNDLYPSSTTFARVYKGRPPAADTATVVPGSSITIDDSVPASRVVTFGNYGSVFDSDGLWTMELVTRTPFGTDRLAQVSFTVHRLGVTLEGWRQAHFDSGDNSGDGADINDFDHDGIPNLVEYAFGFDPEESSCGLLPAARKSASDYYFSFTPPAGITDVVYGAEWSTSFLPDSWTPISDSGVSPQRLFSVPIENKQKLFLRLRVTGQ